MSLQRRVQPELLDTLAADDPRALRSRRDLRRINRMMATLSVVLPALDRVMNDDTSNNNAPSAPRALLELGAGDGTLMLRVARARAVQWPGVNVALLDRQYLIAAKTLDGFRDLGWVPEVITADVFDWLAQPTDRNRRRDIVFANLFVHHFAPDALPRLFAGIAACSRAFVCCEPRRAALPLLGSHLVGLIGANSVTREDAVLSIHAGFRDQELSVLWPDQREWRLHEYPAGLFSHCFLAARSK